MKQISTMKEHEQLFLLTDTCTDNIEGEWDFTGEDTQYLTHGLHPYLASMIPQIPYKLLKMYASANTKVLDPFVGGGAVLVESYLAGLDATGIDVNPLAIILSKAKTTPVPQNVLLQTIKEFNRIYLLVEPVYPDFPEGCRIDYWFKPSSFEPLARIGSTIKEIILQSKDGYKEELSNLLACVFSNTVRDVSLTYRGEVRLRRLQGKDFDNFNPNVLNEFKKRMEDAFSRVSQLPIKVRKPDVYECDNRQIPAEDNQFDLVITSPPYGDIKNTIPYDQFSKNMLYWLGDGQSAINRIRKNSLGAKLGEKELPSSNTLLRTVEQMTKKNLISEAIHFYADYQDSLAEIARVTSQRIIIVIGHRILNGLVFDNPTITTEIMNSIGWKLEAKYDRSIRKKRINRKMGFGNNAQGGTIDIEAILVYVPKP